MKGYKVFNSDWTCRGFQYKVGETYEIDEKPIICKQGFHFCQNLKDCFYYYPFHKDVKIAEVEALGKIDNNDYPWGVTSKHCTNKIKILREIPFENLKTEIRTKTYDFLYSYNDYTLEFPIEKINILWDYIPIGLYAKILDKESIVVKLYNDETYMFHYTVEVDILINVKEKSHELQ